MAKKKAKKKAGAKASTSKTSKIKEVGKKVVSAITGKKSKGSGKGRRKRGALWYAKEIQRLKLKKRYEKIKYRV